MKIPPNPQRVAPSNSPSRSPTAQTNSSDDFVGPPSSRDVQQQYEAEIRSRSPNLPSGVVRNLAAAQLRADESQALVRQQVRAANQSQPATPTPSVPSGPGAFTAIKEAVKDGFDAVQDLNQFAIWATNGIPDLGGTPNPLSVGDLETYQLTFYLFGNQIGQKYVEGDYTFVDDGKLVFAKSGVTDIGFKSLEVEQITGISEDEYTATSTKIRFTLVEAAGVTLMDRIASAVVGNGIENFQKGVYGIDIAFKKRDPSTGEPVDAADKKTIKITVIKMDFEITHAGAVYNFEAVALNDMATSDQTGNTASQITIPNGKRASEVLTSLAKKLTEHEAKDTKSEHASTESDVYEIILDNEILATDQISPDSPSIETTGDHGDITVDNLGNFNITVNNSNSINRFIDMVMSSTKWAQKNAKPNNEKDENLKNKYEVRRFYKIRTTVELIGYDKARQDYVRKYTYRVVPFDMAESITQPEDKDTIPNALGFLNKLKDKVNKVYKYIYTGENTEVIKVDVKFNYAWFTPIPSYYGQQVSDMHVIGAAGIKNDQREKLESARVANTFRDSASPSSSGGGGETIVGQPSEETPAVYRRTLLPSQVAHDANGAVPRDRLASRSFVAGIYNAAAIPTSQHASADMMTIDMTIRGDPDWMGGSANPVNAQPYLQFIMFLPIHNEQDGGRVAPSAMLSGLYRVQKITNKFEGGKFTQELFGVRDTTMITS